MACSSIGAVWMLFRLSYYCVWSSATHHLVQDCWYYCHAFHMPLLFDFHVLLNCIVVYNFSVIDIEGSYIGCVYCCQLKEHQVCCAVFINNNNNTTNVEPEMYDYTSYNWSHWNSNEKLKENPGRYTRKTFDRFTTEYSYTWNITHNTESTAVWNLKPEWWGSLLVQEKYQEEKACDKIQQQQ
jgi:hypothetical protein